MPALSHRAVVLQESAIRKLDLAVRAQTDAHFYRLNIGQPDVPTPSPLLEAIRTFQPRVVAYGPASGLPECREAAAAYHSRWSPGLSADHCAVTTGGSEALLFAFSAIADPGDELLVLEPYYTNYNGFATIAGAVVRGIRTRIADGFAIPPDTELDEYVTPRTKAIVLSNPANPTGAVYDHAEMARLAAWAARHDLFLVADEVYRRIYFGDPPASALALTDHHDRVVVVDSLSKTYSACGLRLGFLVSRNAELMEKVDRLGQARLGPQPLAQHVGIAALNLPEAYYDEVRETYRHRCSVLADAIDALPGVRASHPRGAFYTMVELPVPDTEAFARFLVTDFRSQGESVVVAPGGGFYTAPASGAKEIRLAAVLEADELKRAAQILGEGLRAYDGR